MSFAKAVVSGVVGSEPEKRFTPNNHAVTTFNLSVESLGAANRPAGNEPFTVRVTCWRNLADAAAGTIQKGDVVLVEGKLILGSYQSQDGAQKKYFEIEASNLSKLPGMPEAIVPAPSAAGAQGSAPSGGYGQQPSGNAYASQPSPQASPYQQAPSNAGHYSSDELLTEDDIPF